MNYLNNMKIKMIENRNNSIKKEIKELENESFFICYNHYEWSETLNSATKNYKVPFGYLFYYHYGLKIPCFEMPIPECDIPYDLCLHVNRSLKEVFEVLYCIAKKKERTIKRARKK